MNSKKLSEETKKKIMEKYVKTYTTTTFGDILTIYQTINDMNVDNDNLSMNEIDDIINKLHDKQLNLFGIDWICSNSTSSFEDEDCDKKQDSDNTDDSELSDPVKIMINMLNDIFDDKSEDETHESETICNCMNKQKEKVYSDETKNYKEIKISVPGVERGNISLTVKDNILTMKLKNVIRESDFVDKDMKLEYQMKPNYDVEHINSKLENGVLTIHIPKIIPLNTDKTIYIK